MGKFYPTASYHCGLRNEGTGRPRGNVSEAHLCERPELGQPSPAPHCPGPICPVSLRVSSPPSSHWGKNHAVLSVTLYVQVTSESVTSAFILLSPGHPGPSAVTSLPDHSTHTCPVSSICLYPSMVTSPINNIHVKSRHFSARTTWLPCHPELETKSSPLTEDPESCPSHLLLQPTWTACPSSNIPSVALILSPPCPEFSSGRHGRVGPLLECHPGDICCTCRKWHPEALRTPQAACLPDLSFHSPRGDCMHCPHLPSPPALTCQTPEGRAVSVCSCRLSRCGREHAPTRVQRKECMHE